MSEQLKDTQEASSVTVQGIKFASDYKYLNARGGHIGVSLLQGPKAQPYFVMHAARVQFQPEEGKRELSTVPVQTVLGSIELDIENARKLHIALGRLLEPKESAE